MPFTRDERAIIEDILNRLDKLGAALDVHADTISSMNTFLNRLAGKITISDLSQEEIEDLIRGAVQKLIKGQNVNLHTHESDKEGGDAFAKKGASLIEEENIENEEPE